MKAKVILTDLLDMRNKVRTLFLGRSEEADFTGCSPIYMAQKIDSFIVELTSLKVRIFYHARHNKEKKPSSDIKE